MRAIVQDRFGPPDVLELREVDAPRVGDGEVLVRVRAASVNPADWYLMTGTPWLARPQMGLRRPRSGRLGVDLAGEVAAARGAGRHPRPAGRRGVRDRRRHPGRVRPGRRGQAGAQAGPAVVREGGGRPGVRPHRPPGPARQGPGPARPPGADQRGVGRGRHLRRPARQGPRRRGDRRVQHPERRHGPLPGRRPGGGLHREDFTRGDRRYHLLLDVAGSQPGSACRRVLEPQATLVMVGAPRAAAWPVRWATSPGSALPRCGPARRWSSSSPGRPPRTWRRWPSCSRPAR